MLAMDRLKAWARTDRDRSFEICFLSGSKHPWSVTLGNDATSWHVTADVHAHFPEAVDHALRLAAAEEGGE